MFDFCGRVCQLVFITIVRFDKRHTGVLHIVWYKILVVMIQQTSIHKKLLIISRRIHKIKNKKHNTHKSVK